MNNYDYPVGSDTEDAPWNKKDPIAKEIEVTVSITLSKTMNIKVDDYEIIDSGIDEDGEYFEDIDYSNCDINTAVENQIILPQEAYQYVFTKRAKEDLQNWNVDEMEVIKE